MNNIMSGFMEYLKRNNKWNQEKVYEIAAVDINNYLKKFVPMIKDRLVEICF